jgi:hypothetical protein
MNHKGIVFYYLSNTHVLLTERHHGVGGDYTYGNKVVAVISMLGVSGVVVVHSSGIFEQRKGLLLGFEWCDEAGSGHVANPDGTFKVEQRQSFQQMFIPGE